MVPLCSNVTEMNHRRSASVGNRSDAGSEAHRPRGFTREHQLPCCPAPNATSTVQLFLWYPLMPYRLYTQIHTHTHMPYLLLDLATLHPSLVQLERRRWMSACLAWWSARRPPCARLVREWCRLSAPTARRRRPPALMQSSQRLSQVGPVGCGLWAGWVPAVRCGVPLSVLLPHQRQGALLSSQFSGWQPPSIWQRGAAQLPLPSLCSLCRAHLSPAAGHSVHQDLLDDRGRAHHQQQCRQVRGAGARGRQAVARSLHCDWNQCWPQQPPPAC